MSKINVAFAAVITLSIGAAINVAVSQSPDKAAPFPRNTVISPAPIDVEPRPFKLEDKNTHPEFMRCNHPVQANMSEYQRLQAELANSAARESVLRYEEFRNKGEISMCLAALRRLLDAQLALTSDKKGVLKHHAAYCDVTQQIEAVQKWRFENGVMQQRDLELTTQARIEARLMYLKAAGQAPGGGAK